MFDITTNHLMLIGAFLTLATTIGGIIYSVTSFVEKKVEPILAATNELTVAVEVIRTELVGSTGENGMKSEIRTMRSDIAELRKDITVLQIHDAKHS